MAAEIVAKSIVSLFLSALVLPHACLLLCILFVFLVFNYTWFMGYSVIIQYMCALQVVRSKQGYSISVSLNMYHCVWSLSTPVW